MSCFHGDPLTGAKHPENWNSHDEDTKLLIDPNGAVVCHFGPEEEEALVAISQTQDKLLVFYSSSDRKDLDNVTLITVNDVICCLTARCSGHVQQTSANLNHLLLIGCTDSILVYSNLTQTNLFRISTPTKICVFSNQKDYNNSSGRDFRSGPSKLVLCGGIQKILALRLDAGEGSENIGFDGGEVTCEKSISETVNCLMEGNFLGCSLIFTGSVEGKIRIYQLDLFDYNIQAPGLTIDESAGVKCLCGIQTNLEDNVSLKGNPSKSAEVKSQGLMLPLIKPNSGGSADIKLERHQVHEQMTHFAFGLEYGLIGVYRLYTTISRPDHSMEQTSRLPLGAERLWRHKSKQVPVCLVMFDLNGDGYDELIIGYDNGRLEARSPFTGQLLGVSRKFRTDRLVGLFTSSSCKGNHEKETHTAPNVLDLFSTNDQSKKRSTKNRASEIASSNLDCRSLIACSSNAQLIKFRARMQSARKIHRCFDTVLRKSDEAEKYLADKLSEDMLDKEVVDMERRLNSSALAAIEESGEKDHPFMVDELYDKVDGNARDETINQLKSTESISAESKQNIELLRKISQLQDEQKKLGQHACKVYQGVMRQMTMLTSLASHHLTGRIEIGVAHKWEFTQDADKNFGLDLIIMIGRDQSEQTEFVELIDRDEVFFGEGLAVSRSSQEIQNKFDMFTFKLLPRVNKSSRLTLRVYCSARIPEPRTKLTEQHNVSQMHVRHITVPKYCNLIPRREGSICDMDLVRISFRQTDVDSAIIESLNQPSRKKESFLIEVLKWLGTNLICFQTNNWITNTGSDQSYWSEHARSLKQIKFDPLLLTELTDHTAVLHSLVEQSPIDPKLINNTEIELDKCADFELILSEFALSASAAESINKKSLNIVLSYDGTSLNIASNDYHLLIDVVKSLAIEHLRMRITSDNIASASKGEQEASGIEPILHDIENLTQISTDLEETERRVQAELYESSDSIHSLIQQLYIAQQINEFTIAKELLSEIGIMFDGAQNSAKTYYLNNRERLRLSKNASRLKEKISFLVGS